VSLSLYGFVMITDALLGVVREGVLYPITLGANVSLVAGSPKRRHEASRRGVLTTPRARDADRVYPRNHSIDAQIVPTQRVFALTEELVVPITTVKTQWRTHDPFPPSIRRSSLPSVSG
jgi:hypothetical protein